MRQRCLNRKNRSHADYGGRGIKICDRWSSFENFREDMGLCPAQHVLDREYNDGDYTPANCRWVTKTVSTRNRRCTRRYFVNGELLTLAEWGDTIRMTGCALLGRLRLGWPVELALTTPKTYGRLSPEEVASRRRARVAPGNAVRDGRIIKPKSCQRSACGGRPVQAHHDDYENPLDVVWLCRECHRQANLLRLCAEV
jgi:hypothetical protein